MRAFVIVMALAVLTTQGARAAEPSAYDLDFSTYLGGSGSDMIRDITLDTQGNIYIAGIAGSGGFPRTPGDLPGQSASGSMLAKFSPAGRRIWSKVLKGPFLYSVKVDSEGYLYVAGRVSPGFPTTRGAFQPTTSRTCGFVGDGTLYVGGVTTSRDFPVKNAWQPKYGGDPGFGSRPNGGQSPVGWGNGDCWVAKFRPARGKFGIKTYVYKTVKDLKIKADVYRPDDTRPRPVLLWLHGGALMMGAKRWVQPDLKALCRSQGYCLVSANYRLAPQAKLPQIIEDLRDLMKWVNDKGPGLFHADASRVVVAGSSAGGYLTMMAGIIEPRPKGLVAYYGYGDVDGPWYTTPSEHYRKRPLVSRKDAYKGMTPQVVSEPVRGGLNRGRLYLYYRQNGLWTKEVTGFDPATEKHKLDPYCPVRNITAKYPPIVMLHGTADTDVPCQESLDMAKQLKKHNVRHELFVIPAAGHGLRGGNRKLVDKAMARAREFIKEQLGPAKRSKPLVRQ